jgi:hypothetical protein
VDKSEYGTACIAAQQTVAAVQNLDEAADAVDEVLFALAVMVDVDLNVTDAGANKPLQRLDKMGAVLFFGIEEAVNRRPPVTIAVTGGESGPLPAPKLHALDRQGVLLRLPVRLVVIGDGDPDRMRRCTVMDAGSKYGAQVSRQPDLCVTWQTQVDVFLV